MDPLSLFTVALGLPAPWKVVDVAFDPEPGRIDFHFAFASGTRFASYGLLPSSQTWCRGPGCVRLVGAVRWRTRACHWSACQRYSCWHASCNAHHLREL